MKWRLVINENITEHTSIRRRGTRDDEEWRKHANMARCWEMSRPVTRGGSGSSSEPPPPFREPPSKNTTPPHLKLSNSISDISISRRIGPLLTALRTPFNTLSDPPTRSNGQWLELSQKIVKHTVAGVQT